MIFKITISRSGDKYAAWTGNKSKVGQLIQRLFEYKTLRGSSKASFSHFDIEIDYSENFPDPKKALVPYKWDALPPNTWFLVREEGKLLAEPKWDLN